MDTTYLVIGGTGRTGRRVTTLLRAAGHPARVTSRRGTPPFDWHDDGTWSAQLTGARRAYLAFHPDVAAPGTPELLGRFARTAADLGLERIVLLSGRGEEVAREAEERVRAELREVTVLRSSFFMQDFSEHFLFDGVRAGTLAMPAGTTAEPFVDADDLAEVAVQALTTDTLRGRTLELTGPQLLTFADAAAVLSDVLGRTVAYQPCTAEEYAAGAAAAGLPPDEAAVLAEVVSQVLDGRNARLTDDVASALGRPPRDFRSYAEATARSGVWDAVLSESRG